MGRFTLILCLLAAFAAPAAAQNGNVIRYGETVSGAITDDAARAQYAFRADAGDVIGAAMARTDGNLDTYLMLYGPDGKVIAQNDDAGGSTARSEIEGVLLARDGIYALVATRFFQEIGQTTGRYTLTLTADTSLREAFGPPPYLDVDHVALTYAGAESFTKSGRFGTESEDGVHKVVFPGRAGDSISASVLPSEALTLGLTLKDAAGNVIGTLGALSAGSPVELGATLPADGWYVLELARRNGSEGGDYELRLTLTPAAGGDDLASGPVTGTIDGAHPARDYIFEGAAGESVTITMARTSGDLDTYLILIGPDGGIVAENDDAGMGQSQIVVALPESGTYTVRAGRFAAESGTTSGDFTLTLERGG
jgi:hypothetical protein